MHLLLDKFLDEELAVPGIGGRWQRTHIYYMVAYAWYELYRLVGQYVYLLYLVLPQFILHQCLRKEANVTAGIELRDATRHDDHVGGVLRVRHHAAIVVDVIVFAVEALDTHYRRSLRYGDADVTFLRSVALRRIDERHAAESILDDSRIYIVEFFGERIHGSLLQQRLHLLGIKESVFVLVSNVDDDLRTQRYFLRGFVPRSERHEEICSDAQVQANKEPLSPVDV